MNMSTQQLQDLLNRQIASWTALYVKLHNYHWYVKGPQFYTLHEKFEELYEEAARHIDDLAERLLALGGRPAGTMRECLEKSAVREASGGETAEQMVAELTHDFAGIIAELKAGMDLAASLNDQTTEDMLLQIRAGLEKHLWMLRAFLGQTATFAAQGPVYTR
jgi:starvation-inducible DNA-binding protein